MTKRPLELPISNISSSFDGTDYIYQFGNKFLVHYEAICNPERFYAENFPLFTASYTPKPGDVVVDIGAGNGLEIQEFSQTVGRDGRVIAIEADPDCFRRLTKLVHLAKLDNVTCINAAASDSARDLYLTRNHPGGITNYLHEVDDFDSIYVQTVSTQEILKKEKVTHINLLKINIEGHEYFALLGLKDMIQSVSHLVVSCHDFLGIERFKTRKSVTSFLVQEGFIHSSLSSPKGDWEKDYVYAVNSKLSQFSYAERINDVHELNWKYRKIIAEKESEVKALLERIDEINSQLVVYTLDYLKERFLQVLRDKYLAFSSFISRKR